MKAACGLLWALALALGAPPAAGQRLTYVEPGIAACPVPPSPARGAPKTVRPGVALQGSLRVDCGFEQGSYTVTLHSTDPGATFAPQTFVVNFGRIVGKGDFTVTFATPGVQRVSASITSNMGSPAVRGGFVSAASAFEVVAR